MNHSARETPQDVVFEQLPIDWTAQRDEGIARSSSHAENIEPGWSSVAYAMLCEFCQARNGCYFTSEDVRRWCQLRGFETEVPKAWGGVFLKASRRKLIRKRGTSIAKQRHGSPCPEWEVA